MTDDGSPTFTAPLRTDDVGQYVEIPDAIAPPYGPCVAEKREDGSIAIRPLPRGRIAQIYYDAEARIDGVLRRLRRVSNG